MLARRRALARSGRIATTSGPQAAETALPGSYDFTLKWTFDLTAETLQDAAPSLSTAMREQLGLRLDSTRGKAEVLVIDHVERPSEN